jgi:poly-gamma-glutamate synthesis protein (capsule biosynthesis protein)
MQRKITWITSLSILVLSITVLGGSYCLRSSNKEITPNNQQKGEKDFLDFLTRKKKLPQTNEEVSFIAVGDISYSRGVERIVKQQKDINYPFLKISDYLKDADLVFGNLETPITQGPEIPDFEMVFRSNPGTEQALKEAGFSIVSLANNHTPNFGEQGLKDTFSYLEKVGIKYVGAGKNEQEANQSVYIEAKGIKFAFFAYNDANVVPASYEAISTRAGTAFMRKEKMIESVKEAKQKANFVIVSMHSGTEYADNPNDSQVSFAHAAIDAGADLVIGHHPHVVQTMENYKGKYIFYGLGNFVFDQMWSQETEQGLIVKAYFTKDGIGKISILPVMMENFAQPKMAKSNNAEKILQRLKNPLESRVVYFWNSGTNNFEKTSRATIYEETPKSEYINSRKEQADLDNNLIQETYTLENGRLTIDEDSKTVWQSPDDWWVDNFALADSTNDGISDINLSLWKAGNFGESKPFWVEENDISVKNHFFVFDYVNGVVKQIWGSSNLGVPNCEFKIMDIDGDGKNDLIVVEGDYSQEPECKGSYVSIWKWNDWGFSNEWRSEKGNFANLEIEKIDGKSYIVVDFP